MKMLILNIHVKIISVLLMNTSILDIYIFIVEMKYLKYTNMN